MKVKYQSLPSRCSICHQADLFNPATDQCLRCKDLIDRPKPKIRSAVIPPAYSKLFAVNGVIKIMLADGTIRTATPDNLSVLRRATQLQEKNLNNLATDLRHSLEKENKLLEASISEISKRLDTIRESARKHGEIMMILLIILLFVSIALNCHFLTDIISRLFTFFRNAEK